MGLSGVILKDRRNYSPEELLRDAVTSAFRADLNLMLSECDRYDKTTGDFKYAQFNISVGNFDSDYEKDQFIFEIFPLDNDFVNDDRDTTFEDIDSTQKLYNVAVIEKVSQNENSIFKFAYEYLKLNPKDYIWFEDDFAFDFQDMERLSKLPFDENWCYKNPKNLL
ncbi:hypothetical protein BJV85_002554 [Clostridium acetobutylicum]|uniref:Uncharacterized protein n=1 Tax=Clostridium acetobutylicum (strain ATCC 824 / DSM 792 / JCM 1419 / IAM 19013 / LMG 5710 / NBRC 13948 / NRRL B-527 / VKM B-1787 / 2291 / W) TaxID=272562 RepID=Q97J45_CLOAB|nr:MULTISPECIES: hypothetical protein [Clostridium]AAK79409.1 Hypothetical protein CA_C1441 [Clostridium acetobutylicum ATCC 824]ADZ20494.1 Conserved hypothetical protein [Clostridium acetobutylicum EA 2018]AEI31807.1 hypothetical protein SMB_G1466 [Clostridium acetobutylicum DSM 1731]AWV81342.1 hypothetical protein DK921_14830 [Clostridium acetobutylicum]MBC2392976.1 hypothetical protein [Clostridium acetobutylicum]